MFVIKLDLVLFLMINCHVSNCERRIEGGQVVKTDKSYVVYLVKASISTRDYEYWLCGGALVTTDFIITSAACVEDVNYLYAIAGYNKYVPDDAINKDECTKTKRKKVIFTCVPVSYNFDFDLIQKWAHIDIALARVDSPYKLGDESYLSVCSYIPTIIAINYDPKYQLPETDAIVYGWGHNEFWRKHGDRNNYNQEMLQYTPTLIMDKNKCKEHYEVYPNMTYVIDQYMICTLEAGTLDEKGELVSPTKPTAKGCSDKQISRGLKGISCEEEDEDENIASLINTRRAVKNSNRTYYNYTMYDFIKKSASSDNKTRRNGICQNDHGGPLVTWVGAREILIGVASVFKINEDDKCIGPFLYTSTQCNGAFLDCVLNAETMSPNTDINRRSLCDSPPSVKGFDLVENHISWKDHPAGPAANEMYGANEKYEENKRYTANEDYAANVKFIENERSTDIKKYPVDETYLNPARVGTVDDGVLVMRPQRPLRGSA